MHSLAEIGLLLVVVGGLLVVVVGNWNPSGPLQRSEKQFENFSVL